MKSSPYQDVLTKYRELFYGSLGTSVIHPSEPPENCLEFSIKPKTPLIRIELFARVFLLYSIGRKTFSSQEQNYFDKLFLTYLASEVKKSLRNLDASWPQPGRRKQSLVEASLIAFSLSLSFKEIWEEIDIEDKLSISTWLRLGLVNDNWKNNWVIFPGLIESSLCRLENVQPGIFSERALMITEKWYKECGIYSDGKGLRYDYYNAWSYHFFLPFIASWGNKPDIIQKYADRMNEYTRILAASIDECGAPIYQGRSLTYRFGILAPFWIPALLKIGTGIPNPGELTSKVLSYFWNNKALEDGQLKPGWLGGNAKLLQSYSNEASPYWGAIGFIGLLVEPDSTYWKVPNTPDFKEAPETQNNHFIQLKKSTGVAQLNMAISDHKFYGIDDEYQFGNLYDRGFYSSVTAPVESKQSLKDNQITINGYPTKIIMSLTDSNADGIISTTNYHEWKSRKILIYRIARRTFGETQIARSIIRYLSKTCIRQVVIFHEAQEIRTLYQGKKPIIGYCQIAYWPLSGELVNLELDGSHITVATQTILESLEIETPNQLFLDQFESMIENPFGNQILLPVELAQLTKSRVVISCTTIKLERVH